MAVVDELKRSFAEARRGAKMRAADVQRQGQQQLKRAGVVLGVGGSGAIAKEAGKQRRNIMMQTGTELSQLGAAEAGALEQREEQKRQRTFAEQEALKQREFAMGEAEKERAQREREFSRQYGLAQQQFGFQQEQFAEAKRQFQQEFDLNKQISLINSALALRESDLVNPRKWRDLSGLLQTLGLSSQPVVRPVGRENMYGPYTGYEYA